MANIFSKVPRAIKGICAASFLINMSTVLVFSLFSVYLHKKIGIGLGKIGLLEGAVDSFAFAVKSMSGVASDFFVNRKLFFLLGATLMFVAKPLEATATTYWPLFQAKLLERFGNGLQSTPRDALVGDWSPDGMKSTCFGLRQSCTAFGTAVGAVIAVFLMKYSGGNYQFVFWMSSIPSFLAVIVIVVFVSDKKYKISEAATIQKNKQKKTLRRKITLTDIKNLNPKYWFVIVVAFLYMLAKIAESIIIVHVVSKLDLKADLAPICMLCFGLATSFISTPAGIIADKIKNKDNILMCGVLLSLLSNILFAFGTNLLIMIVGIFLLGSYIGIASSIFPAKIVEIVPVDLKGTALGIFNFVCALALLTGGVSMGGLAEKYGMNASFLLSALTGVVVLLVLVFSKGIERKISKI